MLGAVRIIWMTDRAAGITALVLASLTVAAGLLASTGAGRRPGPLNRPAHEALSLATLAAIGVHGMTVLADPWLKPGLSGVLIPFAGPFKTVSVAAGIIAGWGIFILGLSYYARTRIGAARWRKLHRWIAAFWVLAIVHGFTSGTDSRRILYAGAIAIVAIPAAGMLLTRLLQRSSEGGQPPPEPLAR